MSGLALNPPLFLCEQPINLSNDRHEPVSCYRKYLQAPPNAGIAQGSIGREACYGRKSRSCTFTTGKLPTVRSCPRTFWRATIIWKVRLKRTLKSIACHS